jgi:hypothetical protein
MGRGVGSKNKRAQGLRHYWNFRHDSAFFNYRGSLPDFVETQKITNEWQILTIACLVWVCERSSNNVAKFANVAHVKATHIGIKRKSPAHRPVRLFMRSEGAQKILIVAGRDDERMVRERSLLHEPINLGLAGKVGNVELAAADRFYVWQCGPDKMFDTGNFGSAYRIRGLLDLTRACFPKVGDEEDAIRAPECSFERFRLVQISFDDFVGELAVLIWMAGQRAHRKFAAALQGMHDASSLLPRCTGHCDQFFIIE